MMYRLSTAVAIILYILLIGCTADTPEAPADVVIHGHVNPSIEADYLLIGSDTLMIENGQYRDTLTVETDGYVYAQLSSWRWPRLILLNQDRDLEINITDEAISANDPVNQYLLNKDSILTSYTAKWDMDQKEFESRWEAEMAFNFHKIDSVFAGSKVSSSIIHEMKQIELMYRAHLTSNFVSFQSRKGNEISDEIYHFVNEIDLHNPRLEYQVNNRNFQYFYTMRRVSDDLPDSIYTYAALDTVEKYVKLESIKDWINRSILRTGLTTQDIDNQELISRYPKHFKNDGDEPNRLLALYERMQKLEPGNTAPEFGQLKSLDGWMMSLDDFQNKNILISAWGSWCPFCLEELPHIKRLAKRHANKLTVVAISLDRKESKWREYINTHDWDAMHLIDPTRGSTFRKNYIIGGTNMYYLIDKRGIIRMSDEYTPSDHELDALITDLK